ALAGVVHRHIDGAVGALVDVAMVSAAVGEPEDWPAGLAGGAAVVAARAERVHVVVRAVVHGVRVARTRGCRGRLLVIRVGVDAVDHVGRVRAAVDADGGLARVVGAGGDAGGRRVVGEGGPAQRGAAAGDGRGTRDERGGDGGGEGRGRRGHHEDAERSRGGR